MGSLLTSILKNIYRPSSPQHLKNVRSKIKLSDISLTFSSHFQKHFSIKRSLVKNMPANQIIHRNGCSDQDWSYGEILAGRPGAWLVKKFILYACNQKKLKRKLILKFKMITKTCLNFMIAFMVYE